MPKIRLKHRMAGPDGNFPPGFVMEINADEGQKLVDFGAAEWVAPPRHESIERAVHLGGGWYEVAGERIRGKKAAEQAMKG
jgi:hypothetical protein